MNLQKLYHCRGEISFCKRLGQTKTLVLSSGSGKTKVWFEQWQWQTKTLVLSSCSGKTKLWFEQWQWQTAGTQSNLTLPLPPCLPPSLPATSPSTLTLSFLLSHSDQEQTPLPTPNPHCHTFFLGFQMCTFGTVHLSYLLTFVFPFMHLIRSA